MRMCVCSFECSCVILRICWAFIFVFLYHFFLRFHVFSLPLYWCRLACPLTQVCSLSHIWCGCSRATAGGRIDAGPDSTARIAAFHAGVGWPGAACLSSCTWRREAIRECRGSAWQDQPAVLPQDCCGYGKIGSKFSTCPTLPLVCSWFRGLKFKGKGKSLTFRKQTKIHCIVKICSRLVLWILFINTRTFLHAYAYDPWIVQAMKCSPTKNLQQTWSVNVLLGYKVTIFAFIMIFFFFNLVHFFCCCTFGVCLTKISKMLLTLLALCFWHHDNLLIVCWPSLLIVCHPREDHGLIQQKIRIHGLETAFPCMMQPCCYWRRLEFVCESVLKLWSTGELPCQSKLSWGWFSSRENGLKKVTCKTSLTSSA